MSETMLTVEQIAQRLNVSIDEVRRFIKSGVRGVKLPAVKLGRGYRIKPIDLEEFLAKLIRAA